MALKVTPYLNFAGNCREAVEFYHTVIGGELSIQTFGQAMPGSTAENANLVMHATIVSSDIEIMASDTSEPESYVSGNNNHVSLSGGKADTDRLRQVFTGLLDGAAWVMPLEVAPWGAEFGMLTDKFGQHWMVNIDPTA